MVDLLFSFVYNVTDNNSIQINGVDLRTNAISNGEELIIDVTTAESRRASISSINESINYVNRLLIQYVGVLNRIEHTLDNQLLDN